MAEQVILEMAEAVLSCLRLHRVAPECQEEVTRILETHLQQQPSKAIAPPTIQIVEIRISKFKKIQSEDIPWGQDNIFAFPCTTTTGYDYRWISVRYNNFTSDDFLLVCPIGVTVSKIRSLIGTVGVQAFSYSNPLGKVFNPGELSIKKVCKPDYCGIPVAYMSSTYVGGVPTPIALGIIHVD